MHQEYQYLNILKKIMDEGKRHENRTGVATKRLLCEVMRFDLSEEFPLLTTKKVYWKGVMHELLWFLSGSTDISYLKENKVNIWTPNAESHYRKMIDRYNGCGEIYGELGQKEFLEDHPFFATENPDEIGPVYGFQWRHFNGGTDLNHNPGFDQIAWAENEIRNNPESRRTIISAWNPLQIPEMALPPCHVLFQLTVDGDQLHCTLYQRSCDELLGIPWNISSYALLTCMFASASRLKPGTFNHVMNDAHIYENHFEQVKEQLSREPYPFPQLKLNPDVKSVLDFTADDIELVNYKYHPAIKAEMAV